MRGRKSTYTTDGTKANRQLISIQKHLKLNNDISALGKMIVNFMTHAITIYNASRDSATDAAFTDAMWLRASDVKYAIRSKCRFVILTSVTRLHRKALDQIIDWVKKYKVCKPPPHRPSFAIINLCQERSKLRQIVSFDAWAVDEIVGLKEKLGQALLAFGVSCMFSILY